MESENNIGKVLKVTGIITFIAGFIGAIILGNALSVDKEIGDMVFNYSVMFLGWIGSFLFGISFIAVGEGLNLLEKILNDSGQKSKQNDRIIDLLSKKTEQSNSCANSTEKNSKTEERIVNSQLQALINERSKLYEKYSDCSSREKIELGGKIDRINKRIQEVNSVNPICQ